MKSYNCWLGIFLFHYFTVFHSELATQKVPRLYKVWPSHFVFVKLKQVNKHIKNKNIIDCF